MGLGLAWPFRKTGPSVRPAEPPAYDTLVAVPSLPEPIKRHTTAKMASMGDSFITPTREPGFDLANHPALANQPMPLTEKERPRPANREKPTSRPAYATAERESDAERRQEILHIVRNTDTLEKLAERYLGDAGRAMEIFDLNRDQLSNPHLLPIGAKLKIPEVLGQ